MKKINKKKIVSLLYKRLDSALSKKIMHDAITVINNSLIQLIIDDESISISNFGTLSPYLFHAHDGMNIASGSIRSVSSFRTVKFRAHSNFAALIEQRKDKFKRSS